MKRNLFLLLAAAVCLLSVSSANALTMNPFKRVGRVKNSNLLIAGNIVPSRLLADLAQWYTKQPVLLISPDAEGNDRVYYAPASSRATAIEADKFMEIVDFVNPSRVIVLGGRQVVDEKFVEQISAKYKVLVLDSADWSLNASSLSELLGVSQLRAQFDESCKSLEKVAAQKVLE